MEDEHEHKALYQTHLSHGKLTSRVAWSIPINLNIISPLPLCSYIWRMLRLYVLKPQILIFGSILVVVFMYLQAVEVWGGSFLGHLQYKFRTRDRTGIQRLGAFTSNDVRNTSWEWKSGAIALYAIQGRRPRMEDRFVIKENVNNTDVGLLAIFDGHGGEFVSNYAKENLVPSLCTKVKLIKDFIQGKQPMEETKPACKDKQEGKTSNTLSEQCKKSFKATASTPDERAKDPKQITNVESINKLDNLQNPIAQEVSNSQVDVLKEVPIYSYFDKQGVIDYSKLLTDEVLAADQKLLEIVRKNRDEAGSTALIALLDGSKLFVANVGDSRAVMCDGQGNAVPLSFDHKPQQMREQTRIKEAGGSVIFNGVWRVAGILATSRALGDYNLKDKKFVIADPDVLIFDLNDHKPLFLILATDGLWDTFSNEEAVAFIKDRLDESDHGVRSITLQSYHRGSFDNITVIVINFKELSYSWNK